MIRTKLRAFSDILDKAEEQVDLIRCGYILDILVAPFVVYIIYTIMFPNTITVTPFIASIVTIPFISGVIWGIIVILKLTFTAFMIIKHNFQKVEINE